MVAQATTLFNKSVNCKCSTSVTVFTHTTSKFLVSLRDWLHLVSTCVFSSTWWHKKPGVNTPRTDYDQTIIWSLKPKVGRDGSWPHLISVIFFILIQLQKWSAEHWKQDMWNQLTCMPTLSVASLKVCRINLIIIKNVCPQICLQFTCVQLHPLASSSQNWKRESRKRRSTAAVLAGAKNTTKHRFHHPTSRTI